MINITIAIVLCLSLVFSYSAKAVGVWRPDIASDLTLAFEFALGSVMCVGRVRYEVRHGYHIMARICVEQGKQASR